MKSLFLLLAVANIFLQINLQAHYQIDISPNPATDIIKIETTNTD